MGPIGMTPSAKLDSVLKKIGKNREKSREIGEPKSESRRTTDQTTGHLNTVHKLREPREGGRQGEPTG